MNADVPHAWTVEEVATHMNISVSTARRWLRRGHLRGIKVDQVVRVIPNDLVELLERHSFPVSD